MGKIARYAPKNGSNMGEKREHYFDYSLLFIVLFLIGFGLIMIYSASSYVAFDSYSDAAYFFKRQAIAALIGLVFMGIVSFIPYHFWENVSFWGYIAALVLVFAVKSPLGVESHGARRWIKIPGIPFQLQPAEVAKIAVIFTIAYTICVAGKKLKKIPVIIGIMAITLPMALVIKQVTNNLSSALIVLAIGAVMVFVASSNYSFFVIAGSLVSALAVGLVFIAIKFEGLGFRFARIKTWLNPESDAKKVGFQTLQGLYAIGSGGIWGKGLGQSMQKLNFLPEAQNDMIFAIICEELGLFGAFTVIILFSMLIWRMMVIANNAQDNFGAMLVVGVIAHIAVQVILNIAVVTNTIPNTGISLPFISYGGSSIMLLLIEIGIVFNVGRNIPLKEV